MTGVRPRSAVRASRLRFRRWSWRRCRWRRASWPGTRTRCAAPGCGRPRCAPRWRPCPRPATGAVCRGARRCPTEDDRVAPDGGLDHDRVRTSVRIVVAEVLSIPRRPRIEFDDMGAGPELTAALDQVDMAAL